MISFSVPLEPDNPNVKAAFGERPSMTLDEELQAAITKFEKDMAFTAPELYPMRVEILREQVKNIVDDFMAHGEAK
jgi:hypothetical protein